MKILSKNFIKKFGKKIINMHPSLLPKYKGLNTHERAIKNNEKYAGCTVHYVTSKLDSGKIILQNIIDKLNLKHLISPKKQGFSVNTTNMWYSYGQKIFEHYFDKSCLIEDKFIK